MKIAFVHRSYVDYMVETPYRQAVGGSESALCYLAVELAKLGHEVSLVTNTSTPGHYRGVECLNYKTSLSGELMNRADVVVISNEACAREMRDKFGVKKPLVLWVQHADDQPAIEALQFTRERKCWSSFAYVSEWQAQQFSDYYWMPREKGRVMRNAIAPVFADLPVTEPWFKRGVPPTLIYTSMPYRGLDVLLDSFPRIRESIPGTRLRVYSSMARVQVSAEADEYGDLYRRCTTTDGVDYVGPVGQAQLAAEMADAAALSYPSTYPETSCIAAMEAMAVGAAVLVTRTGALPETTAGFGHMIDYLDDKAAMATNFAAMAVDTLTGMMRDADGALRRREAQIAHIRTNAVWSARALEWQGWLAEVAARGA